MKQVIAASVILGISNMAMAADSPQLRHRFTEYANVVEVEPIYKRVRQETPSRECWIENEEQVVIREGSSQRFGETQNYRNRNGSSSNNGGAIVGGLIGGVIGNQLGRKAGRGARNGATVAGAIIGSVIANEANSSDSGVTRHRRSQRTRTEPSRTRSERIVTTRPVEKCRETTNTTYEQQLQAYDVTYEFRGKMFTTRMKRDPGSRIELQVNVAPARH